MKIKNLKLKIKCLLVILGYWVIGTCLPAGRVFSPVHAEEIDLSLYPPLIEMIATPGSSLTADLILTNHTDSKQELKMLVKTFKPSKVDEDGKIISFEETLPETLTKLVHIEKDQKQLAETFALRPNEAANLTLSATITKEASPSDTYFTLIFQTINKRDIRETKPLLESPNEIGRAISRVEAGVSSNILLSIRDAKSNQAVAVTLADFSLPIFSTGENIPVKAIIENKGLHFLFAKGEIAIRDIDGRQLQKLDIPAQNILAYSKRKLYDGFLPGENEHLFGKYTAQITIFLDNKYSLIDTKTFYVVPQKILFGAIGGLLIISFFLHRFQRYTKFIKNAAKSS